MALALLALALAGCSEDPAPAPAPAPLASADGGQVHLADALATARVEVSQGPVSRREARTFSFREPRPEWAAWGRERSPGLAHVSLSQGTDAVRVALSDPDGGPMLLGGLVARLDAGPAAAWAGVRVRARARERLSGLALSVNPDAVGSLPGRWSFLSGSARSVPVFGDGSVQDYLLPLAGAFADRHDDDDEERPPSATGPGDELRSLGVFVGSPGPGSLEILSITLVPQGEEFHEPVGVGAVVRAGESRHALYAHAPAELGFPLTVPAGGRLDLGLSGLPGESVMHVVRLRDGTAEHELLSLAQDGTERWTQRQIDLSRWAGQAVELILEARSEQPGSLALWGAPIVSGTEPSSRPNVIFYVIDGGGADQMSVYGYERETTPFLEELAREGVLFERAHSNSTWTQPSTASFMTGLHHSVLGGLRRGLHSTPVPDAAVTMAEHFRRGGWFTASLTTNPNCARVIGLHRGVDVLDDSLDVDHATSSAALHERFFELRESYPGEPWWVHIQTTDVHEPNEPVPPFAGRWLPEAELHEFETWEQRRWELDEGLFGTTSIARVTDEALRLAGLDRHAYYDAHRALYDETMAFQDASLRRFVEALRERGEWEHTLLVIGSDHGHPAGTFTRWGRGLFEPSPPEWEGALLDSYSTRVPLLAVWPGRLPGGLRIAQPVSMIDVLPTLLDLAGLPAATLSQGRSLASALRGGALSPEPVILDEVRVDEASGQLVGNLELIDGRWGASLEVGPIAPGADPRRGRHAVPAGGRWGAVHPWFGEVPRLLLYDLEADRFVRRAVNAEHPELVRKYERILLDRWRAHVALAQHFTEASGSALDAGQLEQLKALGYIR